MTDKKNTTQTTEHEQTRVAKHPKFGTSVIPANPAIKNLMGNDFAKNTLAILTDALQGYRIMNKNLAKLYAEKHLRARLRDPKLVAFMLNALKYEDVNRGGEILSYYFEDTDADVEIAVENAVDHYMQLIRSDHRWFTDLMLFLNDKYTARQLLNSDFVKVVKNRDFLRVFAKNAEAIDFLTNNIQREYANYKRKTVERIESAKEKSQHKQK